jgi:hypothetical protein
MPDIDPAILIFLGTVFGGVGLRWVDHWLTKRKSSMDEGAAWRKEQREEILSQDAKIEKLQVERDKWRDLYYDLREAYALLKVQLELALSKIKRQADDARDMLPEPDKLPPHHQNPEGN